MPPQLWLFLPTAVRPLKTDTKINESKWLHQKWSQSERKTRQTITGGGKALLSLVAYASCFIGLRYKLVCDVVNALRRFGPLACWKHHNHQPMYISSNRFFGNKISPQKLQILNANYWQNSAFYKCAIKYDGGGGAFGTSSIVENGCGGSFSFAYLKPLNI